MKIAGVGINPEQPPKKEVLIKQALKGADYNYMKPDVATALIEIEIEKSGLYRNIQAKPRRANRKD